MADDLLQWRRDFNNAMTQGAELFERSQLEGASLGTYGEIALYVYGQATAKILDFESRSMDPVTTRPINRRRRQRPLDEELQRWLNAMNRLLTQACRISDRTLQPETLEPAEQNAYALIETLTERTESRRKGAQRAAEFRRRIGTV